ncbi:MAG TPA: hypothetical protein VFE51_03665 [Verrucomicrobiae bacterium]|nr:hypothetical protein [Verrucomicrobiae bacterium]
MLRETEKGSMMRCAKFAGRLLAAVILSLGSGLAAADQSLSERPKIVALDPPEKDFFAKELFCENIPIKAPSVVADEAMLAAYDNLARMLTNLPMVASNLVAAGVELHIIGRNQVTTDLPEWRQDKGKPLAEYNGLTRDQRTRGMGGRLTSCGEENLLKLREDRYFGRDICAHEFSHSIRNYGIPNSVRQKFNQQYQRSLNKGLWKGSYAGSNPDEFFAELTMWYFGTHGDLHMSDPKPENGPEGLRAYDPEAFALLDDFYKGRIPISRVEPREPIGVGMALSRHPSLQTGRADFPHPAFQSVVSRRD